MRNLLTLLFLVLVGVSSANCQQLKILSNGGSDITGGDLLTGSPFVIDAVIQVPAECTKATISIDLPTWISLGTNQPIQPDNIWSCASSNCYGTVPYSIDIESVEDAFANGGGSNGSDGINFQINLMMGMGNLCEGVQFDFTLNIEYFSDDNNDGILESCGSDVSSTASIFSKYADDYWKVNLFRETPESDICLGGFTKYRIEVPRMTNPGGYNSVGGGFGGAIIINTIGEVHKLLDENYNELSYSQFNSCTSSIQFGYHPQVYGSKKIFYLITQYDCEGCDYFTNYGSTLVQISPNLPCNLFGLLTDDDSDDFDPNELLDECCGIFEGTVPFVKSINYSNQLSRICPGSCLPVTYSVLMDNSLSPNQIVNPCIEDEIPNDFDISAINLNIGASTYFDNGTNGATLYIEDNYGNTTSIFVNQSNANGLTLASLGVPNISKFTLCLNNALAAFSGVINFSYTGKFNDDAMVGDLINPCATALGLGLSDCAGSTIVDCESNLAASTFVLKSGVSRRNSVKVNREEKATIQMTITNTGTSNEENADLNMTLPSAFTYCAGTVRYYYLPTSTDPASQTSTPLPDPLVGGSFSVTGQDITLSDFDLEARCTSGKTLFIEIDVLTAEDAIAGPNLINYTVNGGTSGSANLTVNSYYQVEANMFVSCEPLDCNETSSIVAYVEPGDDVYFKMEIENKGNVVLDGVNIYNNIPLIGDQNSVCNGNRNSEYQVTYSPPVIVSCTFDSDEQYGNITTGACPTSFPSTWSSANKSAIFMSADNFYPGDKYAVVFKATVQSTASFGSVAVNDFAFDLLRNDVPGRTEKQLSNQVKIFSAPTECGEYADITDISCDYLNLTLIQDTIPNVDSCCVTITIQNAYADAVQGIYLDNITGEYFDNMDIEDGYVLDLPNDNQSLYVYADDSLKFPVGNYTIGTFCYDALYSNTQSLQASIQLDTIGSTDPTTLCVTTFGSTCPANLDLPYWTKIYNGPGTQTNTGTEIKAKGNHFYQSGRTTVGSVHTAYMSKFDLDGNLIWHQEYPDLNSSINNFIVTEDEANIIAVGLTYPHDTSNSSLLVRIDALTGIPIEIKRYNSSGRERFQNIIYHPNALNSNYPYYINGYIEGNSDRPIILNLDENLNINWNRKYGVSTTSDDQLIAMFPLDNGNVVLAGEMPSLGGDPYIAIINGSTGAVEESKQGSERWRFILDGFDYGNGIIVVGELYNSDEGIICIHDYNLNPIHSLKFIDQDLIRDVVYASNDTIYTIAFRNITSSGGGDQSLVQSKYPVISRFVIDDSGSSDRLEYVDSYKFEHSNQSYSTQKIFGDGYDGLFFLTTQMDFASDWKNYMGILPLDMNSNCIETYVSDTLTYNYTFSAHTLNDYAFTLPTATLYYASDTLDYTCTDQCDPDCQANFDFSLSLPANDCGVLATFNNTSTATTGNYNWIFGDGQAAINVENTTHLFDEPGTYNVCLHALGCPDSRCIAIEIEFDTKLPNLICPSLLPECAIEDSCYTYVTLPGIILSGGNTNCVDTTIIRADGQDLDAPYYIGTTNVIVTITNSFGASASCNIAIEVTDCQYPEITCPSDLTVAAPYNETSMQVDWEEPIKEFYCNKVISTQSHYSGDYFDCGTTTVTYTIDELNGQTATCNFDITVECDTSTNRCGQAAFTCFPGFVGNNPSNGIDYSLPVYGISDIRDRSSVSPGYWAAQSGSGIYHPSNWTAANLGLVFGMTIDSDDNVYLAATTVYGCDEPGFSSWGPGGAAGIYKIDPSDNITTVITTGPYDVTGNGTTIPNNGGGLGNICYNPINNMCYVTNLSDGHIYQIDGSGLVVDRFDPFAATTSGNDFAALGDRPWGIAYNELENRLYYSNWVEDRGRINATENNTIYSVDLDGSGFIIPTSETLHVELPNHIDRYDPVTYNNYSSPVSDIAFGEKGKMLISERSMWADCGDAARSETVFYTKFSHNSRVLEYQDYCGVWNLSQNHGPVPFNNYPDDLKFQVGSAVSGNVGANSSGGIDYGYSNINNNSNNDEFTCDAMVWASADYMWECSSLRWYGIQGIPQSGGNECDSYIIDFDGISSTNAKVMQGDVEVFKCLDCSPIVNTCCEDFDDEYIGSWGTIASSVNAQLTGPSLQADDYYLRANDGSGSSWIYNSVDFIGDYNSYIGNCLCWDFRVFDDGSSSALNVSPILRMYQGSPTSPTLEAQFIPNIFITEVQNWMNVCAPIELAVATLPSNDLGQWVMITGSGPSDWNSLLSNVSGIRYYMDLTSSPTEKFGFDNICFQECNDLPDNLECPDLETYGELTHLVQPDNFCCFRYTIDIPMDTLQDEMTFQLITPGVEFGSFTPDGQTNNNYPYPDRKKGAIQHDGIVDYCLSTGGSFPSEISVVISSIHYLDDGSQFVLCRDTITAPCGSNNSFDGCYVVVDSMVTCDEIPFTTNGNYDGYEIKFKIENQSDTVFESLVLTFDDESDFFWNPTTYSGLGTNGLIQGDTSDWLVFSMSPNSYITDTTEVCFDIHPVNAAGNYCCNEIDPYCVTIIPCCIAEDSLSVLATSISPTTNEQCCVELSFTNDCAFNYIKNIEAEILTEGISLGAHTDLVENWSTVSVSDTELHYYPDENYVGVGTFENIYKLCVNNILTLDQSPQEIEFRWMTCDTILDEQVIFRDTISLDCLPIVEDQCVTITNDSLRCGIVDDTYYYDFTLNNNSGYEIDQIAILPIAGTLATDYYPQTFIVNLDNGSSYSSTISLLGDVGDHLDIRFRVFDNDSTSNYCCYQQDTIALDIESCCQEILVIEMDPVIAGDYYASEKIILMKDVGKNVNLNLYTPLVEVDESVLTEQGSNVFIEPKGCGQPTSLNFDGMNDYVDIDDYSNTGNLTISGWFKLDESNNSGADNRIFSWFVIGSQQFEIGIDKSTNNIWLYENGPGSTNFGSDYNDDEWHHLALVRDGNNRTVYVDGQVEHTYTNTDNDWGSNLFLGRCACGGTGHYWNGNIDDFYIIPEAKSAQYIEDSLYCSDLLDPVDADIYYDFDGAVPSEDNTEIIQIDDQSGNGVNGQLLQFALDGVESNFVDDIEQIECCTGDPVAVCLTLVVEMNPSLLVTVNASGLNDSSSHPCGQTLMYSYTADTNNTTMSFDCDDIGTNAVTLYVTDEDGVQVTCQAYVIVQDSNNFCDL